MAKRHLGLPSIEGGVVHLIHAQGSWLVGLRPHLLGLYLQLHASEHLLSPQRQLLQVREQLVQLLLLLAAGLCLYALQELAGTRAYYYDELGFSGSGDVITTDEFDESEDWSEPEDKDVGLVGFWLLVNSNLNGTTKLLAAHQLLDLVQACTWKGKSCNIPREFSQRHYPLFGNCFTFNSGLGEVKTLGLTGFLKGLSLVVFLEQPEYVGELSHSSGLRLVVHEAGRTPFPMEEGIDISPGFETSIGVRAEVVERAKPPHGDCTDGEEENKMSIFANSLYSSKSCEMNCLTQGMLSACGCVHPLYGWSELPHSYICTTRRGVNCTDDIIYHPPQCSCRQPCHGVNYVYEASMSTWPSVVYQKLFLNDLRNYTRSTSLKDWIEDFVDEDGDAYIEISRANFAKINVYFQTLNYEQIITRPSYEEENLLGDLGGQLGLWIGFSIMTCVEFVELLVTMVSMVLCGCLQGSAGRVKSAQDLPTLSEYPVSAVSAADRRQIQASYRKHPLDGSPLQVSLPAAPTGGKQPRI